MTKLMGLEGGFMRQFGIFFLSLFTLLSLAEDNRGGDSRGDTIARMRIITGLHEATNQEEWNRVAQQFEQWVRGQFQRKDLNRDGFLDEKEMPPRLREELKKWDTNKDKKMDVQEYADFSWENILEDLDKREGKPKEETKPPEKKPEVKVVKPAPVAPTPTVPTTPTNSEDIPKWFRDFDLNRDGQLGMNEWIKAKRPFSEFQKMDQNNDGLFTKQELKRALKLNLAPKGL